MDISLHRKAGVPVREQIAIQVELKIIAGELRPGERLPSIRTVARRLKIHANTASAAYRLLEERGYLESRRGSGVFVRGRGTKDLKSARNLDEMIQLSLSAALARYPGAQVRAGVLRWLAGKRPDRIVVVDPSMELAHILARELSDALHLPATACSPAQIRRQPRRLARALAVALPSEVEALRAMVPGARIEAVNLELPASDRNAVLSMAPGVVLLVSHSPEILEFGAVLIRSLRGDAAIVEPRLLRSKKAWERLLPAADLVLADAVAAPEVMKAGARRVREVRFVSARALRKLGDASVIVVPVE